MAPRTLSDAAPGALGVIAATKLRVPHGKAELVPRDALVALVAGAPHTRLTLLSAPAGAGKTTLLTLWHRAAFEQRPFAWLSLDRSDDDPVRFWACAIEALRTVVPGVGERAGGALRSPRAGLRDVVLPLLINDLAAWDEEVVLVFDDLHEVTDPRIHSSLSYLLDHLPATVHVAVATRTDPDLPLPRLRARDEVVELRAGHLRFSDAEAAAFLNDGLGLGLGAADVAALQVRTEGWAAGLQLAGLSLRARAPANETSGGVAPPGDRLVVDYLVTEVLDGVPEDLRTFLRRTAILDRVSPELAAAVTGDDGAAARLRELERRNLFTVAVDAEGHWYRYHPLFADTLRRGLQDEDPGLALELHQRAAAWWAAEGALPEAIGHALRGGDTDLAAELVARGWSAFFNRGWLTTVAQWLRALPDERVRDDPGLWLARAWTSLDVGALDAIDAWLAPVEGVDDDRRAWADVLRALHRFKSGDVAAARASIDEAVSRGGPSDPFWQAVAELVRGVAGYWSAGAPADVAPAFARARRLAVEGENILGAHYAAGYLAMVALDRGDADSARATLTDADALVARQPPVAEHFTAMTAALARGRLARLEGDIVTADAQLQRAVELAHRGAGAPEMAGALLEHADALRARGDLRRATARAAEAEQVSAACTGVRRLTRSTAPAGRRAPAPALGRDTGGSADDLSASELRVLRLLPSDLSLRQIGGELYLSLNTVKTHTRSIYAKLRVGARDDAVRRARELGLV